MKLTLFNTLSRKKEIFKPLNSSNVGMYSCGPTVYWYATIGNQRTYVFSDLLRRVLEYNKYRVKHVVNVTDVGHLTQDSDDGEDKMEKAAKKEGKTAQEIADHYLNAFKLDFDKLNILVPTVWSKATDHIPEQIKLIETLERKGYTYETSDGIYYNSGKFKDYGKLARLNIENLKAGKRTSFREKKNKADFALWKFSDPKDKRQQEWESPWSDKGFPGWHIECSAMSMKYLGESFDIHTAGEDHISVHSTNEIAQSEAATGKKFVNYWLHGTFLLHAGEKVSKSKGGLYTVSDLEGLGFDPLNFRYLCLLTHYRKPLNFSLENLEAAKTAFERVKRKILELKSQNHKGKDLTKNYDSQFLKAVNDDLNVPLAVQVFLRVIDDFNFSPKKKLQLLYKFDKVLGLGLRNIHKPDTKISKKIELLVNARELARKEKNFEEADAFRQQIREKGFEIEDTEKGPRLLKT